MTTGRTLFLFFLLASAAAGQESPAPPIAELPGPLVIVGGGKTPAASSIQKTWQAWSPLSIDILHTRDRQMADAPDFVKPRTGLFPAITKSLCERSSSAPIPRKAAKTPPS